MSNEFTNVHIWELPEKTNDVDKSNEYTLLHDGFSLKKATIEKLYEYFAQNYKIENVVNYFETLMKTEDLKYEDLYSELESILNSYGITIENLENGFTQNRNKIREIETSINQTNYDINDLLDSFETEEIECSDLSEQFIDVEESLEQLIERNDTNISNSDKVKSTVSELVDATIDITGKIIYISSTIEKLPDKIDNNVKDGDEEITQNINNEYDKIVSIIDHYNHEHDEMI